MGIVLRNLVLRSVTGGALLSVLGLMALPDRIFAQSREELIYQEGVDALYNLYFSVAEERFQRLAELEPENPVHWNNLASTMWLKIVASQEKLNMESFSGASLGTDDSKDVVSSEAEARLRTLVATALSKADVLLMKSHKDVKALYARGAALATLAAFEAVVKQAYVSAYRNAREARRLHSQVVDIDPSFKDARLTIGVYDYAVGSLPRWLRFLLSPFGLRGDKEGGLETIADVGNSGLRVSIDAKFLLIVIYNRERQYQNSLALVTDLHRRYPKNYLLEISKAALQSRLRIFNEAIATYTGILDKIEARRDGYERLEAPKVLLLMAKAYLDNSEVGTGMDVYDRVISYPGASGTERANAHLWLGKLHDVMHHRAQALPHYNAILSLDCTPRLKQEARNYKRKPFAW